MTGSLGRRRPKPTPLCPRSPCLQDAGRGRLLDPSTRAFSDFPAWVDAHQGELAGRQVLMYCTGGVRCERASAYLRSLGEGFQDVCQLSGEAFSTSIS